jgi:hypothetical protein
MLLKNLINKSVYGNISYVASQDDLNLLEQYILYNLPVLKEYKQIITATNYKNYPEFVDENTQLWKKYFPDCIIIDLKINRGPNFGYSDLDDALFDYCKENNIEWLCKSANDMIIQESILNKEIEEADFYYMNGIGYSGAEMYNFDPYRIINEYLIDYFYPQTNFYFINVSKTNFLNDKNHITEIYNKVQNISDYNGKAWEYGFKSCEFLLKECVERNKLFKYHLVSNQKFIILTKIIKQHVIVDSSHKNIMIEGICHFAYPNQTIIQI